MNVQFFGNRKKSLSAYFQFAPDGLGSRFACKLSGALHFNWFNRPKSSQIENLPTISFLFIKKPNIHTKQLYKNEAELWKKFLNYCDRTRVFL